MKVCIVDGCWFGAAGARCPEHERQYQHERNQRRGPARSRHAAYRQVSLVGQACWCCGATEGLTRHHVTPLSRNADLQQPTGIIPMCRPCNSSIGTRQMGGLACPMHGGYLLPPGDAGRGTP